MKPYDLNTQIEQATACSIEKRKKLVSWFSRQNTAVQIEVFIEQRNQFFKLNNRNAKMEIVSLASFLLAIDLFYQKEKNGNKKNKSQNIDLIRNISQFEVKKHKKIRIKEKREKLLNIWSVVQKLKSEEYSFRDISKYIRKRHRFDASHTYIIRLWKELEKNEL
ncbi:MAG: hypothetical protein WC141_10560 [Arcobacteraceae bacterium]